MLLFLTCKLSIVEAAALLEANNCVAAMALN
jgi:hypothetical protein